MILNRRPILAGAIALIFAIAVFGEIGGGLLGQVAQNTAHVPAFGLIAWLVFRWLEASEKSTPQFWRHILFAFFTAVVLGVGVELAQWLLGRDAELSDVLHDAEGALAALALTASHAAAVRKARAATFFYAGLAVIATGVSIYPLAWATTAYLKREKQLPVLVHFESQLDSFFFTLRDTDAQVVAMPADLARSNNETALRLSLNSGAYPGIEIIEPHADWTRYSSLSLEVANPTAKEIELSIRVHDRMHNRRYDDRFTQSFAVPAHTRLVHDIPLLQIQSAPRNRAMQLDHIDGVIVFSAGAQPGAEILLKQLWLH